MLAAWYTRQGSAAEVLQVGERDDPHPGPGEVRVRVRLSGINPGDIKKREGWLGSEMPYPLVIPHSDAAGTIDEVGAGIDPARLGSRVWTYGAQSYRAFGTAAQYVVVPSALAVELPDTVADELAACLGIPGITAHRAVFADGAVEGKTVLVQGVLGGVSSLAAQLAHWGGAKVIGTVRHEKDKRNVDARLFSTIVALDDPDTVEILKDAAAPQLDRIIEVALSDNVDLDAAIVSNNTIIATYFSRDDRVNLPFSPFLFDNVVIRFLGSDDFSEDAKSQAAGDLTRAAANESITLSVAHVFPLADIAEAHDTVDKSPRGRVLLQIP